MNKRVREEIFDLLFGEGINCVKYAVLVQFEEDKNYFRVMETGSRDNRSPKSTLVVLRLAEPTVQQPISRKKKLA